MSVSLILLHLSLSHSGSSPSLYFSFSFPSPLPFCMYKWKSSSACFRSRCRRVETWNYGRTNRESVAEQKIKMALKILREGYEIQTDLRSFSPFRHMIYQKAAAKSRNFFRESKSHQVRLFFFLIVLQALLLKTRIQIFFSFRKLFNAVTSHKSAWALRIFFIHERRQWL